MQIPDWLRRLNYLGKSVGGSRHLVNVNAEELIYIAKESTGLNDFGDDSWKSYYYDSIENINKSCQTTVFHRLHQKTRLLLGLRNRLIVTNIINSQPMILEEPIAQPLIITGLARTGTSILFNILSQDAIYRTPLMSEACCPFDPSKYKFTDSVSRTEISECMIDLAMDVSPERITMNHNVKYNAPAECAGMLAFILCKVYPKYNESPNYQTGISKIDIRGNYRWHKKILQLLQYDHSTKPWLLKCPSHIHYLEQVFEAYPNARVIHTHRDPIEAILSALSMDKKIAPSLVPRTRTTAQTLEFFQSLSEGALRKVINQRQNSSIPANQITDIHFHDLMSNPIDAIRTAYKNLGLNFTNTHKRVFYEYILENPRHKYGKHNYGAKDLGLSNNDIKKMRDRFYFYTDHYNIALNHSYM